jgi:competence protein ComEA
VLGLRDTDDVRAGESPRVVWTLPAARGVAALLAFALAVAGWWWWTGRPRDVIPAPAVLAAGVALPDAHSPSGPAPAQGSVVVHVIGKVLHPGVVRLPPGSRVADAVAAAGGATDPQADSTVNLARLLMDGEQVAVGVVAPGAVGSGTLSLSTATVEQLDSLPGIGPVLAARIITWRTSHGPFRSVDQLGDVPGIGPSLLSQLTGAVQP